jgi:large repetitive protein
MAQPLKQDGGERSSLGQGGSGLFGSPTPYGSGGYGSDSVAIADVNGDGKPDLIVANACIAYVGCSTGAVGVLLGNGDGTFQPAVSYGSGGQTAESVALADLNGDGKLDIVVANQSGTVGVLLNNGDGTFQSAVPYS